MRGINRRGWVAGICAFGLIAAVYVVVLVGPTGSGGSLRKVLFGVSAFAIVVAVVIALVRGSSPGEKGRSTKGARPGRWE
jgi:hypothetical protein